QGHDLLIGGDGADHLDGGAGPDVFVYRQASDSTAGDYDSIVGFDARQDLFVVPHSVTAIDAPLQTTTDSVDHVDAALAAAADNAHFAPHSAVVAEVHFQETHPTTTPIAPEIFLIVDV